MRRDARPEPRGRNGDAFQLRADQRVVPSPPRVISEGADRGGVGQLSAALRAAVQPLDAGPLVLHRPDAGPLQRGASGRGQADDDGPAAGGARGRAADPVCLPQRLARRFPQAALGQVARGLLVDPVQPDHARAAHCRIPGHGLQERLAHGPAGSAQRGQEAVFRPGDRVAPVRPAPAGVKQQAVQRPRHALVAGRVERQPLEQLSQFSGQHGGPLAQAGRAGRARQAAFGRHRSPPGPVPVVRVMTDASAGQ